MPIFTEYINRFLNKIIKALVKNLSVFRLYTICSYLYNVLTVKINYNNTLLTNCY
jgi:hypothetical protein